MSGPSTAEALLDFQLRAAGIEFERQFRPWRHRLFRFDFRVGNRILVEVQGGGWVKGAHVRGWGLERDAEKSCLAAADGYRVLPVTPAQIRKGVALAWIEAARKFSEAPESNPIPR